MELVGLPLSSQEEEWLEKFLTEGKGRTLRGAEDTVLMRRIATGGLAGFAGAKIMSGKAHGGVDWMRLQEGVRRGLGPREGEEGFRI